MKRETGRHPLHAAVLLIGVLAYAAPTLSAEPEATATPAPTAAPTPSPEPGSLAAAASRIKLKKPRTKGEGIVITNENLPDYAAKGALTFAKGSSTGSEDGGLDEASEGGDEAHEDGQKSGKDKREYWQKRYKDQLKRIQEMKKRIKELDKEIPGLWAQFYSWDDPVYRDSVIKPKLDKALAESETLKKKLPEEEAKLDRIREEARRDGALPGWFRGLDAGE